MPGATWPSGKVPLRCPRAMLSGELGTPAPIAIGFGGCDANSGARVLIS